MLYKCFFNQSINLWGVKWKKIFVIINQLWNIKVSFAERFEVASDGWCMLRAITGFYNDHDPDLVEVINSVIAFAKNSEKWSQLLNDQDFIDLNDYKVNKRWNKDVIDLLPAIVSDFLNRSIIVLKI